MIVIGITGGVGSGKSEVLRLLKEEFGARLLMADDIAHEVMEPEGEACRKIEKAFGSEYLKPDGSVDRQKMADRIFKDTDALETMNSIVHPAVWKRIEEGIQTAPEKLVAVEAALFDEEHNRMFDEVWYIYTSEENRVSRLMASRGYTREKCLDIMGNQKSEEEFRAMADRVIDNNQTIENVKKQIEYILNEKLKEEARA
ncbi:MAG: dephospho-CoA kinase [Clostridium sp.]|nr:dephospho-CoA kinase [Clostridium sp.]